MNTSSALRFFGALPFLGSLVAAVPGETKPIEAKPLNLFSVAPEFTLAVTTLRHDASTVVSRVTLQSADDQSRASIRGRVKYRSVTVRAGDEIVSVNGQPIDGLSPTEFQHIFHASSSGGKINLEVRQPNAKETRHATAVQAKHPEDKFADDATLKQFAEFARPACIFNERGKVLFDTGAEHLIESIVVDDVAPDSDGYPDKLPQKIVVRFKQPFAKAPLLMLADSYQANVTTERKSDREWVYALDFAGEVGSARMKMCRFRISL